MTEEKIKRLDKNVEEFLDKIEDPTIKDDSFTILNLMKEVTQEEPIMWGDSIVGFGKHHYKYPTGMEGDSFLTGFSPQEQSIRVYIMPGFDNYYQLLDKLGTYKTGKSSLYINNLKDVDMGILKEIISKSVNYTKKLFPK
ncbi:MAG: DUF1801 domain-containing protein [Candidatus Hermodarchaeota archaeon]